jgi:hypothetical protein
MPTLQKLFYLDITPEKFIDNCSEVELQEIILLANARLNQMEKTSPPPSEQPAIKALPEQRSRKALPEQTKPTRAAARTWTPEEDAKLREWWPRTSGKDIAKKLNREYKTVMLHAAKIGLRKNKPKKKPNIRQQPPPEPEPEFKKRISQKTAPIVPVVPKKLISVRVDKRTIVQVPAGTDVEKIKNKYGKE